MSKKNKTIRVKLIVNPGAGRATLAANNLKMVMGYLEKNGLKVDVALAKPKEEATPIARQAIKDGYKIVVAMGGDGTIEAVMRGIIGSKARLGILPVGTENNIANSLGISSDLEEACALIASDNTLKLDIGQVKTRNGKKFFFFEMDTIGFSAAIYPDVKKTANGKSSRIKGSAINQIRKEASPKVFLLLNKKRKVEVATHLVMVSNTTALGKKLLIHPEASMRDGLLDISVYPDCSKDELTSYFAAVIEGGSSDDSKGQHYQASKVEIRTSPKMNVMADGIALGKSAVTIKVLPGALRVICTKITPTQQSTPEESIEILPEPDFTPEKESDVKESVI